MLPLTIPPTPPWDLPSPHRTICPLYPHMYPGREEGARDSACVHYSNTVTHSEGMTGMIVFYISVSECIRLITIPRHL